MDDLRFYLNLFSLFPNQPGLCLILLSLVSFKMHNKQVYLSRATFYGTRGRYSKAILNCNQAIKVQPNSVRAYLYRGAFKYFLKVSKTN